MMTDTVGTEVAYDPFAGTALARAFNSTEAQREIWIADRLSREASLAFNESISLRLAGRLNIEALLQALLHLAERHEALRATFSADGMQMLIAAEMPLHLGVEDLTAQSRARQEELLHEAAGRQVQEPFDLDNGPLFRASLFLLGPESSVLMLTSHHIVCDGWSFGVLVKELMQAYAAFAAAAEPELPAANAFGDYAASLAEPQWVAASEASIRYWVSSFDRGAPVLDLPVDGTRPSVRTFASRREDLLLDADLVSALRKVSAKSGASLFATLLGGFGALMGRLSASESVVVGVPAADQSAHGMDRLVGHCVNLLPIEIPCEPGMTAAKVIASSQRAVLDAYDHQACSFGEILSRLRIDRDPARLPLVSVQFNLDSRIRPEDLAVPGMQGELTANARAFENFELFVNASQSSGGITLECQYSTELFSAATIRAWLEIYRDGLQRMVGNVEAPLSDIFLPTAAQLKLLNEWNATSQPHDRSMTLGTLLAIAAARAPGAIAVVCEDQQITHGELDARSNQLARLLRERGAGRGTLVGLCLNRSIDMLVAQIAALKCGAGYVPLDPAYPRDRLAYMASDANLAVLLTQSALAGVIEMPADKVVVLDTADAALQGLAAGPLVADAARDALPSSTAYVIYTSGSTGKPKGVAVPHGAVVNFLLGVGQRPGIGSNDRLLAVTTLSFDIAVLELLLPLATSARVVLATRDQTLDGALLVRLLESSGATMMQATPATWRLLLEAGWRGKSGFRALVGGEALPRDLAQSLLQRVDELWNMYGPTETTVWSTASRVQEPDKPITIGTPLANQTVYVLDEKHRHCPVGVAGELWIGGEGVTTGYVNQPAQTAERFVPDPFSAAADARMYRTGDRGRWTVDGQLEHQGRLDAQVKVRGFRIELGEIESQLATHPAVSQCVVIVREDNAADVRIVAYFVAGSAAPEPQELRAHLQKALPEYMIPQHFVALPVIPRLPNGKVDRKGLPRPVASVEASAARVAPRTEMEARLLKIMESVLNLPGIGIRDSFFSLGGHSLLAARLTAQINREEQVNLPLRTIFEVPTVEQLAVRVEAQQGQQGGSTRARIEVQADQSIAPLTLMQERIRFMEELHPGRVVYNTPSAHRLSGNMDVAAFRKAFARILERQPSLRTCVERQPDGSYVQRIQPSLQFELPLVELDAIPEDAREAELMRRMQALIDQPLDIGRTPLFVAVLYRMTPRQHVFLFMPHHIIWDGWSFDILYEEIAAHYAAARQGRESDLKPLEVSYGDYATWYSGWLESEECRSQVSFWKQRFANAKPLKAIPADRRRQAGMSGLGAVAWVGVDKALTERLRELAVRGGVTLNMVTMAVHAMLLSQATQDASVVLGMPVRGRLINEVEPVMGFFNNLLPFNLEVDAGKPFASWLADIRQQMVAAFANQDVPFEKLAAEPEFAPSAQGAGLYQSLFSFQDARHRTHDWGGLRHQSVLVMQKGATEDFGLWLMDVPHGLEGGINYNADVFDAATAELFRERYLALLARVAAAPESTLRALLDSPGPDTDKFAAWIAKPRDATDRVPHAHPDASRSKLAMTEKRLAELWGRLLGLDSADISAGDNFFDLGGNSMLVMQAVAAMEAELGLRVEPRRYLVEPLSSLAVGATTAASARSTGATADLAAIWANLLGMDAADIGDTDNFFDLGGNSLLAMQAITASAENLGIRVEPQRYLTEGLAQLALGTVATVETRKDGGLSRLFKAFGRGPT